MSARLTAFFFLAAFVAAAPAAADPVGGLYSANVPVRDQSTATREPALKDALAQVLVKATGVRSVLESEEGRALLENPARYLQQYRYESIRPAPVDPDALRLALYAEFDGAAIERRLRAAGLPLWGRERPMTLLWVAVSDIGERQLLGEATPSVVADALRRAANRRGIPVQLPVLDAEDATRVSFMDVWGVFEEPLLTAAERYAPDAVLAGSVFKAGDDLWAGRWTLLRDGQRQRFEVSGGTPEAVAVAAIEALTEHYAAEFSVQAPLDGTNRARLEITGVERLKGYAGVQAYLAGLSVVKDVRLARVGGDTLRFELDLNGNVRALEQAIALGRVLEPLPSEEVTVRLGPAPSTDDPAVAVVPSPDSTDEPRAPEAPLLRYRYRQ